MYVRNRQGWEKGREREKEGLKNGELKVLQYPNDRS